MIKIDNFTMRRCFKRLYRELNLKHTKENCAMLNELTQITDLQYAEMAEQASKALEDGAAEAREMAKRLFLEKNYQTDEALEREKKRVMVGLATLLASYIDDFKQDQAISAALDTVIAETFDIYFTDMMRRSLEHSK